MPLLDVKMVDFPNYLLAGEVSRVTLVFTNFGKVPLSNVKVALSHTNFFAFGHADSLSKPFPRFCSASDSVPPTEDNDLVAISMNENFSIVCLKSVIGVIQPKESVRLPMWVRGQNNGSYHFRFLFYYQSLLHSPLMPYRVHRVEQDIRILPSLHVNVFVKPAISSVFQYIIGIEVQNQQGNAVFQIEQLSCLSPKWAIIPFSQKDLSLAPLEHDPTIAGKLSTIGPRQSTTLFFRIIPKESSSLPLVSSSVSASSCSSSSNTVVSILHRKSDSSCFCASCSHSNHRQIAQSHMTHTYLSESRIHTSELPFITFFLTPNS